MLLITLCRQKCLYRFIDQNCLIIEKKEKNRYIARNANNRIVLSALCVLPSVNANKKLKMMNFVSFFLDKIGHLLIGSGKNQRPKDKLGQKGEKKAAAFLKSENYQIVARNVRFSNGEIDIIAVTGRTLVFVEVKTRQSDEYCHPLEVVDKKKREKIKQMGRKYCRDKQYLSKGFVIRFDIMTVIWSQGKQPMIEHFIDAFR